MNTLQQLIDELLQRGWTETQIAARLNVSQATVNRWYRGHRLPAMPHLVERELRRLIRSKDLARLP
jgi:transcriptional regulator with XRE-family HTH domain